eukprot:TRINITY_DN249_c0_g1_i1.p1 TRINITY_DN249_c0_g1~~TRINITY_DN249_c0_g1_i1.p1  ORF type:complete len:240 (+),score=77.65 TRINITY_DN249_c0_g1_i1:53-772(+)
MQLTMRALSLALLLLYLSTAVECQETQLASSNEEDYEDDDLGIEDEVKGKSDGEEDAEDEKMMQKLMASEGSEKDHDEVGLAQAEDEDDHEDDKEEEDDDDAEDVSEHDDGDDAALAVSADESKKYTPPLRKVDVLVRKIEVTKTTRALKTCRWKLLKLERKTWCGWKCRIKKYKLRKKEAKLSAKLAERTTRYNNAKASRAQSKKQSKEEQKRLIASELLKQKIRERRARKVAPATWR